MLYAQPQTGPLRIDNNDPLTYGLLQAHTGFGVVDATAPLVIPKVMGVVTQRPEGLEFSSTTAGTARLVQPHEKTNEFTSIVILKSLGTASGFASIFGLMYDTAGNSPYGDQLDRDSTGVALRFAFNVNGSPTSLNTTNNLSSTQFDTIAMTFQSGSQMMYQNGSVIASANLTGTPQYTNTSVIGLGNILGDGRNANVLIKFAARWNRVLSKDEIDAVSANPWRLFEDPYEGLLALVLSTGQSYSYTANGGVVFSGSPQKARGKAYNASGGVTLSGTSQRAQGRSYSSTGGLLLSGSSSFARGIAKLTTGGITFAGTSPTSTTGVRSFIIQGVGGLLLSGTSTLRRQVTAIASGGGLFFGGTGGAIGRPAGDIAVLLGAINDVIYQSLRRMGKQGTRNDMLNENIYWRALANNNQILSLNDVKKLVLRNLGYTGALNNMEKQYWSER